MYIPASTYRIQVNSSFRLADLTRRIDYLARLGITTIYSAPLFQSRSGSVHGYDVSNPHIINPEIGTVEEFEALANKLKDKNIGWLQDIVPNHMAFDSSNPWLMDIFEKGKYSAYYNFFDIDWKYEDQEYFLDEEKGLKGKVMAPFLGGELTELIEKGEVKLGYDKRGFFVKYYSLEYPLSLPSYSDILSFGKKFYNVKSTDDKEYFDRYRQFISELNIIKENFENSFNPENLSTFKEVLYQLYTSEAQLKGIVDHCVETINSNPGSLESILDQQFFKLCHWRTSESKINFRRFFTINDLICLRMENPEVFRHYHKFVKELLDKGLVQGLRIDHIDGLYNPTDYLDRLRDLVGEEVYVVVEKILESEEEMPDFWPIEGTSGYEFLSEVNRLFTSEKNKERFTSIYHDFLNKAFIYEDLVFEKKMFILKEKMGGELDNLVMKIQGITNQPADGYLKEALAVFLASFPVYRVYPTQYPLEKPDAKVLDSAFSHAEKRAPQFSELFDLFKNIFLQPEEMNEEKLNFVMRTQQFTGPLAAKGVEDTVFYLYNRLISHNEVGDSPHLFGTSTYEFHGRMHERFNKTPYSMNATATHDTKRGEDSRMRINALSEFPDEWTSSIYSWQEINKKYKKEISGKLMPDGNDEYFIYQALVGGFPMDGKIEEDFKERFKAYLIKVVREAKVNSDWSETNEAYETSVTDFIENILEDQEFLNDFVPLFEKVRDYGIIYSLGQTLLKITAPGIPDTYQGCELWDLSFVDPDNRRPVDFEARDNYLRQIEAMENEDPERGLKDLISTRADGRIKLYTLYTALTERKKQSEIFTKGEYIQLTVSGDLSDNLIAFARRLDDKWIITVVPLNLGEISSGEDFGLGEVVWRDTTISLPENAPRSWRNIITNKKMEVQQVERSIGVPEAISTDVFMEPFIANSTVTENQLSVAEILRDFPVALLTIDS